MEVKSVHIRYYLFYEFDQDKNNAKAQRIICATYGDSFIDESTCRRWFQKNKNANFDLSDKLRFGRPSQSVKRNCKNYRTKAARQHNDNLQKN